MNGLKEIRNPHGLEGLVYLTDAPSKFYTKQRADCLQIVLLHHCVTSFFMASYGI